MSSSNLAQIRQVTAEDGQKIKEFNFIQVGTSGDVSVRYKGGEVILIKQGLLDRLSLVPVGVADEVLSTGTAAGDIYVW